MGKKGLLSRILYIPKHAEAEKSDKFISIIMPSIVGMVVCMACLFGLTWAWFTNSVTSKTVSMVSSNFSCTAEISRGGEDITPVPDDDGAYSLELTAGEDYTVAVTVSEDTNGNGYLKIITPDEANTYYAGPINNQYAVQSFTVVIRPTVSGVYTFAPRWGTHNGGYNIQGNHLDDDGNLVAYSLT